MAPYKVLYVTASSYHATINISTNFFKFKKLQEATYKCVCALHIYH